MSQLSRIPGISGPMVALLEAAGIGSPEELGEAAAEEVLAKLELANSGTELVAEMPTVKAVTTWQRAAKAMQTEGAAGSGQVLSLAAAAKARQSTIETATIISGKELKEAGISVDAVPVGTLLEEEKSESAAPVAGIGSGRPAPGGGERAEGMQFKPMETAPKAPPETARRNAGMTHHAPGVVWLASAATLIAEFLGFVGVLGTIGVAVAARFWSFDLPGEAVAVPALIPVALLLWAMVGTKARCRLCGQRVFVPKKCLKHVKAARSIFGYVFASALRACFLLSFRCQFCGTKIRLEKKKEVTPADGSP